MNKYGLFLGVFKRILQSDKIFTWYKTILKKKKAYKPTMKNTKK